MTGHDQFRVESDHDDSLAEVLEDVARRQMAGELVDDEEILRNHPNLADQLVPKLQALRAVERARASGQARSGQARSGIAAAGSKRQSGTHRIPTIPGCDILREIHRGGQGIVYEARVFASGQRVAVKVVYETPLTGPHDLDRITREIGILASLRHPHIVSIHDSGIRDGYCYFIMDYIPGVALDEHIRASQVSVQTAVNLFEKIADAVNEAHLRGVIHRDLKPGNIMVHENGEPFVLDFGLAKLTADREISVDATTMTYTGQFVGSVPWASPEQTEGKPNDIDIRSDVYSLGVMFFQILTGEFPYEVHGPVQQVLETIRSHEPKVPGKLNPDVDAEIDAIVSRCLQKSRDRRYPSAGALADDLKRYRLGEPIEAKRDTGWHLMAKAVQRYRVAMLVAIAFVLLASGAAAALFVMYREAQHERSFAQEAREAERVARIAAESETEKAQEIQRSVQELLAWASPERAKGRDVTVYEVFQEAARRVGTEYAKRPEIEAAMRETIGSTLIHLGDYKGAETQFREQVRLLAASLGEENDATTHGRENLGWALREQGKFDEAESLLRELLALRLCKFGPTSRKVATTQQNLAGILLRLGKYAEAEAIYRELQEKWQDDSDETQSMRKTTTSELAWALRGQKKYAEAEPLFRRVLTSAQEELGPDHPNTFRAMYDLARILDSRKKFDEAEQFDRDALAGRRRVLGDDHPSTQVSTAALGRLLVSRHKYFEAESLCELAYEGLRSNLGESHPITLNAGSYLATAYQMRHSPYAGEPFIRQLLEAQIKVAGQQGGEPMRTRLKLANILIDLERFEEAEQMIEELLAFYTEQFGPSHPKTWKGRESLAYLHRMRGDPMRARDVLDALITDELELIDRDHPTMMRAWVELAMTNHDLGFVSEAESLLEWVIDQRRSSLGAHHPLTIAAQRDLAEVLLGSGCIEHALDAASGAFYSGEQALSPGDEQLALVRMVHGKCLVRSGQYLVGMRQLETALADLEHLYDVPHPYLETCRAYLMDVN
ncbi:MAG: tetratricopeptide repeat protein [Phycisphaerae bacterium]